MTLKSPLVASLNFSLAIPYYVLSPLISFALPKNLLWISYWATVGAIVLAGIVDVLNSDNLSKNLAVMRNSGISELEIWASALCTMLGFQVPGLLILQYGLPYNPEWEIPDSSYFSPGKIVLAIAMVLSTDACFYVTHRLLHEHFPRLHKLHHCCVYSSLTTNFFFHPLDLAMEFTAPVLAIWIMSKYCFPPSECGWMFSLCLGIIQGWYSSRHDERWGGDHVKHHLGCSTGYFIYNNYFYEDPSKEKVRDSISTLAKRDL